MKNIIACSLIASQNKWVFLFFLKSKKSNLGEKSVGGGGGREIIWERNANELVNRVQTT